MFYDFKALHPATGYRLAYRMNETNHCPGCGQSSWLVGRFSAECAHCATALPINEHGSVGNGTIRSRGPVRHVPLAA
jgi:hypothetical protein